MQEEEKNMIEEAIETVGADETETVDTGSDVDATHEDDGTITLTQEELDKQIQSAEDKLRRKYNDKIKALKKELAESKPAQKSEQELDFEKRLAALEAREKAADLNAKLEEKGIDKSIADFLKVDVDVDKLAGVLDTLLTNRNKSNAYVPSGHKSGGALTADDFAKMTIEQKERLYTDDPELYRALAKSRK